MIYVIFSPVAKSHVVHVPHCLQQLNKVKAGHGLWEFSAMFIEQI